MWVKPEKTSVDALKFFRESGASCANGPENETIIEFCEYALKTGASKIEVRLEKESDQPFDAELFLFLPEKISIGLMMEICLLRPDEIFKEEPGVVRLWWD